jgi:hypothetical protein
MKMAKIRINQKFTAGRDSRYRTFTISAGPDPSVHVASTIEVVTVAAFLPEITWPGGDRMKTAESKVFLRMMRVAVMAAEILTGEPTISLEELFDMISNEVEFPMSWSHAVVEVK